MDERKDLPGDFLDSREIDNALIRLKQKEIDEQTRSNKVVEGVLKDIQGGIERIAEGFERQ